MYIGTDLLEKIGVYSLIDSLDFTFGISTNSIPYQTKYGIDYKDSFSKDILLNSISNGIKKLNNNDLKLVKLDIDDSNRKINLVLDYNGNTFIKSLKED